MVGPVRANLNLVRCPELPGNERHTGRARRSPQHELEAWLAASGARVHGTLVGLRKVTAADSDRQWSTQIALQALRRTRDSDGRQSSLAAAVTDTSLQSAHDTGCPAHTAARSTGCDSENQLALTPISSSVWPRQ